jgi:2-dehydropantoate 2-reductase
VARARDIVLPDDIVALTLGFLENAPPGGTASMQRDVMAGRPSELETQTGAVVRLGAEAGVATPLNDYIYRCLLPLELHARQQLEFAS